MSIVEVSLRAMLNDALMQAITQMERNRDPAHLRALREGDVLPSTEAEEHYVTFCGEHDFRISHGCISD